MAKCLASAFLDDPFLTWLIGIAPRKMDEKVWGEFWLRIVELTLFEEKFPQTNCFLAVDPPSGSPVGAQIWVPDPDKGFSMLSIIKLLPTILKASPFSALPRIFSSYDDIEAEHLRILGSVPHCYLFSIGVHESAQGFGYGSAMTREVLSVIDAVGLPSYLESSNPKNIPFYLRLGFEITKEVRFPGENEAPGPVVTTMIRPPFGKPTHPPQPQLDYQRGIAHQFATVNEAAAISQDHLSGSEEMKEYLSKEVSKMIADSQKQTFQEWFSSLF
eukprot:CAMPEP_0201491794 /NCGR_PEP_ID=MMETSP0151_2-20130828/31282_1 /ASSEMBLY_ACC=CAM_ASM_000257 /TAXON_ID=200890 /ORGANISM="Paramoeba atlantica, Strain 621/1 / CCAP 1560/9" /LENGTH=272 /DNA_ID=CAMNT_0047878315 /DNA_START=216 /DNA_END=1034 /DNA_ORIENTATION=+